MSRAIHQLLMMLNHIENRGGPDHLNPARAFCHIGLQPGLSLTDLSKLIGLSLSTTSRITSALGDHPQPSGRARHLVHSRYTPHCRRTKAIYLTEAGQALFDELSQL